MSDWERQLDEDYDWRMAELAAIKVQVLRFPPKSPQRQALMRSLWVMLYAHYEGYCKATWDLFLDAIEKERVPCGNLTDNLATIALKPQIKTLKSTFSASEAYLFLTNDLATCLAADAEFKDRYEKISNLPPDKYCSICEQFGLSIAAAETHQTKLKSLVYFRHQIAHGQNLWDDTLNGYDEYERAATDVMVDLALSVIDILDNQKFRKVTPSLASAPTSATTP